MSFRINLNEFAPGRDTAEGAVFVVLGTTTVQPTGKDQTHVHIRPSVAPVKSR